MNTYRVLNGFGAVLVVVSVGLMVQGAVGGQGGLAFFGLVLFMSAALIVSVNDPAALASAPRIERAGEAAGIPATQDTAGRRPALQSA